MSRSPSPLYLLLALALVVPLAGCGDARGGIPAVADVTAEPLPDSVLRAVEARRVWSGMNFNFYPSDPSPDGRLISEVDWATGDLAVIDLESGELRRVTNKGSWTESADFAEYSAFSPDGTQLAVTWSVAGRTGVEVRIVDLRDGSHRVVLSARDSLRYAAVEDWSPDGTHLLVTLGRLDESQALAEVAVADGAVRVLENVPTPVGYMGYSPDGSTIGLAARPAPGESHRDLYLMSRDGSGVLPLVQDPHHDDRFVSWSPAGDAVVFYSDRSGVPGIWMVPVRDGEPAGEPRLVRGDVWDAHAIGGSREAVFYGIYAESPQIHTATVDAAGGRVLVEPEALRRPSERPSNWGAWSRDGTRMALLVSERDGWKLLVRPVDSDDVREIPLPLTGGAVGSPAWTEAGDILMHGAVDGRRGVFRIDLLSGEAERITGEITDPAVDLRFMVPSPDGRTLYFPSRETTTEGPYLGAYDVATGEIRRLLRDVQLGGLSISPDGSMLMYLADGGVSVLPTTGGGSREVYRTEGDKTLPGISETAWVDDGRVIFAEFDPAVRRRVLKSVSIDGGPATTFLEARSGGFRSLAVHPDGRRILYVAGESRGEIWRLSNLPGIDQLVGRTAGNQ